MAMPFSLTSKDMIFCRSRRRSEKLKMQLFTPLATLVPPLAESAPKLEKKSRAWCLKKCLNAAPLPYLPLCSRFHPPCRSNTASTRSGSNARLLTSDLFRYRCNIVRLMRSQIRLLVVWSRSKLRIKRRNMVAVHGNDIGRRCKQSVTIEAYSLTQNPCFQGMD